VQIPLCDVVEPPDFEELLAHYQNVIERDALRQILEFPFDSIQLERVLHGVRTLAPVIPEHGFVSDFGILANMNKQLHSLCSVVQQPVVSELTVFCLIF